MLSVETTVTLNRPVSEAVRPAVTQLLLDAADAGFAKSQEEVPVDRGTLLASGVPPQVQPDGSVVWGYNAPYAEPVEEGSVPHWPPIDPLRGWARRVLGDEQAAYAVQHTIAEKGTDPQPFVAPGVDVMRLQMKSAQWGDYLEDEL